VSSSALWIKNNTLIHLVWSGEWVHQRLDPIMPQKWSGPDPWTGWKLTPME